MRHIVMTLALSLIVSANIGEASEIGDAEQGKTVFKKCSACHQVGPEAKNRVGPQLNAVFGRRAGGVEDYSRYSDGLKRAGADGMVWDLDTLNAYLENPKALVSDTRMNFRGLSDAQERANLLAFLRIYSDNPANIPEAQPTAIAPEVVLSPELLALVGDKDYGEYLSSECLTCHQSNGSNQGIPAITGWPTEDFVVAMHAYKQKIRVHPVMQMMAGRLSDEEIAALAAYFNHLE